MTMYRLKAGGANAERLDTFEYASEGYHDFSPQKILADNPDLIFGMPELELVNSEALISFREYTTARGNIDLLLIGSNGEIIIVETKLLRNPESTRQVVAQIIDYIKSFSSEAVDDIIRKIRGHCPSGAEKLSNDVNFAALVQENIKTGNYKVIVAGDSIHPNVLGMIESIHSAPHLSFTIFLVDLHTCRSGTDEIIIKPGIVASTVEIERSVIRIEIEPSSSRYQIDAQSPEPQGKGTRPILSWDQYVSNLSDPSFRKVIEDFRQRWINEIDDSINMGQVGFSAGLEYGGRRLAIQFVYDNRVPVISEKARKYSGIPNEIYEEYLNDLKQSPLLHDKFLASGRVEVPFSSISEEILSLILESAIKLAKRYKSNTD
jgi:hypothetical protein